MLHGAPHLRACGTELFRDAGPADDQRGILAQQPNDATKPSIGWALWRGIVAATCARACDRRIMRVELQVEQSTAAGRLLSAGQVRSEEINPVALLRSFRDGGSAGFSHG